MLRFTDGTSDEIKKSGNSDFRRRAIAGLLHDSQHATRKKLHYNLDARILQDVLSPQPGGLFVAFVHGKKYNDKILFVIDPHGAPHVQPEEIELMTYDENKEGDLGRLPLLRPNTPTARPKARRKTASSTSSTSNWIPRSRRQAI